MTAVDGLDSLASFGFSVAGGVDVDGNSYYGVCVCVCVCVCLRVRACVRACVGAIHLVTLPLQIW